MKTYCYTASVRPLKILVALVWGPRSRAVDELISAYFTDASIEVRRHVGGTSYVETSIVALEGKAN